MRAAPSREAVKRREGFGSNNSREHSKERLTIYEKGC
jgi:hypothetical protein